MRSFDYVVKRIAFAFATIFVAITLNFVIFRAAPGDATTALRCLSCTDEVRAQVRTELGLDKSKWQQYRIYLTNLAHGDFGRSFQNRQPVLPQLWAPLQDRHLVGQQPVTQCQGSTLGTPLPNRVQGRPGLVMEGDRRAVRHAEDALHGPLGRVRPRP